MNSANLFAVPNPTISTRDPPARLTADLRGRYFLERWRKGDGAPKGGQFCRSQRISPTSITFIGFHAGDRGDRVHFKIDEVGALRGIITRRIGAVMTAELQWEEKEGRKFAARLGWLERKRRLGLVDHRRAVRFQPKDPESSIVFEDASTKECYVIDVSTTGAAIACDIIPPVNAVLALGKIVGRVVRHSPEGFAIQFIQEQDRDTLEDRVKPTIVEFL